MSALQIRSQNALLTLFAEMLWVASFVIVTMDTTWLEVVMDPSSAMVTHS